MRRLASILVFAGAWMLFFAGAAQASLIVSAGSAIVSPGSSGDSLDVTLTNTGPSAITIGAFSFGLSTSSTHVTFTAANTSTVAAPYVFDGMSLLGPIISFTPPGQSLQASDAFSVVNSGIAIGAGVTVGLGHVLFDVDLGAPGGPVGVTLMPFPTTSLSDPSGSNVAVNTLVNGTITVRGGSAVPEPSTLLLTALGGTLLFTCFRRARTTLKRPVHEGDRLGIGSKELDPACFSRAGFGEGM